ncbi:hypothetical protein JCM10296v2_007611 [Rhodotorula toruloides]
MLPSPAAAPSPWAPSPHPTTLPITAPSPDAAQPHRRAASLRTGLAPPGAGVAGAGATTSTGGHGIVVEEPSVEATRNVAVLLGAGMDGEGLLDRVEREIEAILTAHERAFGAGNTAQTDLSTALSTLSSLVALLSRSSVGGFVPSPVSPSNANLSQTHLDQANERSRALYKQLKSVKDGAEVARAALAG